MSSTQNEQKPVILTIAGIVAFFVGFPPVLIYGSDSGGLGQFLRYAMAPLIYGGFISANVGIYLTFFIPDYAKSTRIKRGKLRGSYEWSKDLLKDNPEDAQFNPRQYAMRYFTRAVPFVTILQFLIILMGTSIQTGMASIDNPQYWKDILQNQYFEFPFAFWFLPSTVLAAYPLGPLLAFRKYRKESLKKL